jgi:hypothetical protein
MDWSVLDRSLNRNACRSGWAPRLVLVLGLASACGGHSQVSGGPGASGGSAGSNASGDGGHSTAPANAGAGGESGESGKGGDAAAGADTQCAPGAAPVRRLTRFEYSNTVRDLLGDTTDPGLQLPAEEASGFGNDAKAQPVSLELATAYFALAKAVAERATEPAKLLALVPCAADVSEATADSCARTFISSFASAAYRRPLTDAEILELVELHSLVRNDGGDFASASAAVIAAVLQAPDFLYRLEWGVDEPGRSAVLRPSGDEMATRLSYLFWGTQPDEALRAAAKSGELDSAAGVRAQATRLLDDVRSHAVVGYFFERLLPVAGLLDEGRSDPGYSLALGRQMLAATQRSLEQQIFESHSSWPAVLSAEEAFGDESLAALYGAQGIQGSTLQAFPLDPQQRFGLLTQLAVLAGTTNPGRRGLFVREKLLCRASPPSHPGTLTVSSDVADGLTARERWTKATSASACQPCHQEIDTLGFALENYDALGRYRSLENGAPIDASAEISGVGSVSGPIELAARLATLPETQACFVKHWLEFGYGRSLDTGEADQCLTKNVTSAFKDGGYDVRQLLLDLTQTDAFLYLAKER